MDFIQHITTQNVIIGLLTLAVVYLMYVNYNKSCDEGYSNNIKTNLSIPTNYVGGSPDTSGLSYVIVDSQGNLLSSDNLKTANNSGVNIGGIGTLAPASISGQAGALLIDDVMTTPTLNLNKSYILSDKNTGAGGYNELIIAGHNGGTGTTRYIGLLGITDVYGGINIGDTNSYFYPGRKWNNMYYPNECVIYRSSAIDSIITNGTLSKARPSTSVTDDLLTKWSNGVDWNYSVIYRYNTGLITQKYITINVPSGYNTVWLRLASDRWNNFGVYTSSNSLLGFYAEGYRNRNKIAPDGGPGDSAWGSHCWFPIPTYGNSSIRIAGNARSNDAWMSGIAFSTNPWNHTFNPAASYFWGENSIATGGSDASGAYTVRDNFSNITYDTVNWNHKNEFYAYMKAGFISTLWVPIIPSGRDKLVYIVEHANDSGESEMNVLDVKVANTSGTMVSIERFRTTYDNPFNRHNNRVGGRYFAARIPASLISSTIRFIKVDIDLSRTDRAIYFKEVGTHDLF